MKKTAKLYQIIPDGCRMFETVSNTPENAYACVACWYSTNKKVAIVDTETKETNIYTREIDRAGNLVRLIEH